MLPAGGNRWSIWLLVNEEIVFVQSRRRPPKFECTKTRRPDAAFFVLAGIEVVDQPYNPPDRILARMG